MLPVGHCPMPYAVTCCPRKPVHGRACHHLLSGSGGEASWFSELGGLMSSSKQNSGAKGTWGEPGSFKAARATHGPTVDHSYRGQQGSSCSEGWAQKAARAAGSILTSKCCSNLSSNCKLLGNYREEGRKVFSFFTHKSYWGTRGVWLSGICVLVFARPWLPSLVQQKSIKIKCLHSTDSCRHSRYQGLQSPLRLPDLVSLPRQLTKHLSMTGAQGQRPWPFPDQCDPGTYESSRLRPLGKVCLSQVLL